MAAESDVPLSEGGDDHQARRQIYDIWDETRKVRRLYWREFQQGGVSEQTRQQFEEVVMTYYDELRKYRDKPQITDLWNQGGPWKDGGLDKLPQIAESKEVVKTEARGSRGAGTVQKTQPKRLPARVLYQVSRDLDDIAVKLDFGIEVEPPEAMTDPI